MGNPSIARGMRPNRHSLDEHSATRLLQGAVHPDDAPPGYGSVAGLLAAAASPPALDEDAGTATIAAMVEAIRDADPVPQPRRKPVLGKILAGKAIAAVAVLGLSATGAAAAAGSLPDPVQGVVSDVVGQVGVEIPHPNHGKSAEHRKDGEHKNEHKKDGTTTSTSGKPAKDGTDKADNHGQQTSDAAHDAKADAKEAGEKVGPAVCAAVGSNCQSGKNNSPDDETTTTSTAGSDDSDSGAPGKSGEEHGRATSKDDRATTPTTGGITTGEKHSGRELPSSDKGKGGRPE